VVRGKIGKTENLRRKGVESALGTVLQYLAKYGKYSFRDMPMTEVDSLALCLLSYLKFDGMVPDVREEGPSVMLRSLEGHPDFDKLFADVRFEKPNRALFAEMIKGKRYGDLRVSCYVNVVEEQWETQFSAVTFIMDDDVAYVAFRGTDETIVGWKEDFNMAYLSPVPGQEMSVWYLNEVAKSLKAPFYLGGHSKGGNLAVYSAMNCEPQIRDRIIRIYSLDGPGFRPEVLEKCGYDQVAERVVKILPNSSLVGMLFESDMRFQVVKTRTFGLAQHDLFKWQVTANHLVRANDIYERRKHMDNTLNEWILSLDEGQVRTFVDTLYQVISASEADNLIDFTAEWKKSMNSVIAALKEVDEETITVLKKIVGRLFEIAGANAKKEFASLLTPKQKPEKKSKPKPSAR